MHICEVLDYFHDMTIKITLETRANLTKYLFAELKDMLLDKFETVWHHSNPKISTLWRIAFKEEYNINANIRRV